MDGVENGNAPLMTYPRKHNACWRLFHFKFKIHLPHYFMYGPEYLKKIGTVSTGDALLDRERAMDTTVVQQTPAGMAMLLAQGAPINTDSFLDPATDIPFIFDDIQEHLRDWERAIMGQMHISEIPELEEFREFEALALELYSAARHIAPVHLDDRSLQSSIMSFNARRAGRNVTQEARLKLYDKDGAIQPYVSIVDRIERLLIGGHVWR